MIASRVWFAAVVLATPLASACSDDTTAGQAASGSPGAAGANAAAGAAVSQGGSAGATGGTSQSGAGGTSPAGSAGGPPSALHYALFNVVTDAREPDFEPVPATLLRVELPPRFTLEASVPTDTQSVRFSVGGIETLDKAAPFRLTENADGSAAAWAVELGSHEVRVASYTTLDGSGAPSHELAQTIELSAKGMDEAFEPTDAATNNAWVTAHLEEVMVAKTFTGSVGSLPYRLFSPAKYDAAVKYPVLVYLHGRGPRGTNNAGTYASQLFRGPQSIVSPNAQHQFPSFVVVPQCSNVPVHQEWAHWIGNSEGAPFAGLAADGSYQQHADPWPSAQLVRELVESLAQTLSIEPARVYLTGESMGGFGTWEFTTRWPELFAAGAPMAGYSDRSKVARILKIPFWVFHGDADQSNPVAGSRAMVKALNEAGGSAKYTEFAGVDHNGTFSKAWTEETELLPFLFSQRRQP